MDTTQSCPYPSNDPVFKQYHDEEWGRPVSDDTKIFEKICLEGFQSGLSWKTILHRREQFRAQFYNFDITSVSKYTEADFNAAMSNANIIRNRRKIASTINNAKKAIELQCEYGSLAHFLWQFEPKDDQRPQTITRNWLSANTTTIESTNLSKELKSRGWSFIGPTNMYALMQALGLVNDHVENCPCRSLVEASRQSFERP